MTKETSKAKGSSPGSGKRSSGRVKKEVDYAAMQEFKIEEVEYEGGEDEIQEVGPSKKKRKVVESKTELVTDDKCGQCAGCNRSPCNECSFCTNGDLANCIDLYCMNQKEGRSQREAAREAYLMSLGKKRLQEEEEGVDVDDDDDDLDDIDEEEEEAERKGKSKLSVKEQIDMIMEQIGATNKSKKASKSNEVFVKSSGEAKAPKPKAVRASGKDPLKTKSHSAVYGGSPTAAKTRRCGECEGCMRDDCGQCNACADKPRFGGPGTKKKACVLRYCRTRKLEEDHAQANFPLNSADALKGPRPVSKLGVQKNPVKLPAAGKVEDEEVADEIEDSILQD